MFCKLAFFSDALPYDTSSLRIHIDPGGTSLPRLSERYVVPSVSIHAPAQPPPPKISQWLPAPCAFMMKTRRSQPGQHSLAQGSCSRPACRSAIPHLSVPVCLGRTMHPPLRRFSSPPTWRIAGPYLRGARRRVACRPSGFGARRGRRRRGSGCSCTFGTKGPVSPRDRGGHSLGADLVGV